eukprot:8444447-Alexandrium_andersonii.AAC.1
MFLAVSGPEGLRFLARKILIRIFTVSVCGSFEQLPAAAATSKSHRPPLRCLALRCLACFSALAL